MGIIKMTTTDAEKYLKQEAEAVLSTQEYNAAIKNITKEDGFLAFMIRDVLIDRTSPDDGLTISQLAQQVNEHDNYRIQRALQLIKYMTLRSMHENIVSKKDVLAQIAIFPIYSERVKDKVFFNGATDKRYMTEFMKYLGFNVPDRNGAYFHTKSGGILNLGKKTASDIEQEEQMKAKLYSELDTAMEIASSCATEEEGDAKFAAYLAERTKERKLKNKGEEGNDDPFENLRGKYITEEAFEELGSLANGIISLIQQDEEHPERTNNIMSLIQNNYISEQIKNKTELELTRILLPESVNEVSPEAIKPYVDKIRDALYLFK